MVLALFGYALGVREICSTRVEQSDGTILDIKKSVSLGAKLLVGTWAKSQDSCLSRCCRETDCDMALFKTDGVSPKGNNCYLVHCGSLNNCHMVPLDSFNTFFFTTRTSSRSGLRTGEGIQCRRKRQGQDGY